MLNHEGLPPPLADLEWAMAVYGETDSPGLKEYLLEFFKQVGEVFLKDEGVSLVAENEFNLEVPFLEELTALERTLIGSISHSSKGLKLTGAQEELGQAHTPSNVETAIVHDPPQLEEETYNRVVNRSDVIAAIKAYRDFGHNTATSHGYIAHVNAVQAYIKRQAQIPINELGGLHIHLGNDVIRKPNSQSDPENLTVHKPPAWVKNKDDIFRFLRMTQGEGQRDKTSWAVIEGQIQPIVYSGYEIGLASYEYLSRTGCVTKRELSTTQLKPSDDFLNAFVFGFQDARVSAQMRQQFAQVYQTYMQANNSADLRGYTPESGMPLELLLKVNGGWPDDCAFISELLLLEIDGVVREHHQFPATLAQFRSAVRGYPGELTALIRQHLKLLYAREMGEKSFNQYRARELKKIGQEVTKALHAEGKTTTQVLGGDWFDMTPIVQHEWVTTTEEYEVFWIKQLMEMSA